MASSFDQIIDRRNTECIKWNVYENDVLPMWVADMDFRSPEAVIQTLRERVEHGVFGYPGDPFKLRETIVERLYRLYDWKISPEMIIFMPGVVTGFNLISHALGQPGRAVLMQVPVYFPFFSAPPNAGMIRQENQLIQRADGSYGINFDAFEASFTEDTHLFMLCNPHNPVGRVFKRDELVKMAEICMRHNVLICSDEIHCDLVFKGHRHIPIATLSPEIGRSTVTLMAPSKTFNIAGLECSFAVVENETLRNKIQAARQGMVGGVNLMGQVAALAAYRDSQDWLDELLIYLEKNRDLICKTIAEEIPELKVCAPEGTYLAWLDCRGAGLGDKPAETLVQRARVGMNEGAVFGKGGEGFVRMNFGCPTANVEESLKRIKQAVHER